MASATKGIVLPPTHATVETPVTEDTVTITETPVAASAPVTINDLLALIAAMKNSEPQSTQPTNAVSTQDLTKLVESIQAMTPRRQVLISEFKSRSLFNPTGRKNRELKRRVFQNGARIQVDTLFDEEIALLDTLPDGRFINKLITVRKVVGANESPDQIHIEYANRTPDQRIAIAEHIRSFVSMLRQIHEEAKGQTAQAQE